MNQSKQIILSLLMPASMLCAGTAYCLASDALTVFIDPSSSEEALEQALAHSQYAYSNMENACNDIISISIDQRLEFANLSATHAELSAKYAQKTDELYTQELVEQSITDTSLPESQTDSFATSESLSDLQVEPMYIDKEKIIVPELEIDPDYQEIQPITDFETFQTVEDFEKFQTFDIVKPSFTP